MIVAMEVLQGLSRDQFVDLLEEVRGACSQRGGEEVGPVAMAFLHVIARSSVRPRSHVAGTSLVLREEDDLLVVHGAQRWLHVLAKDMIEIGFHLGIRHGESRMREMMQLGDEIETLPDPGGPARGDMS